VVRSVILGSLLVGAILCGAHAALFSCGGYAQHNFLRLIILLILVTVAGLLPSGESATAGRRLSFAGAVLGVYWLSRGALAPLYPGMPASIPEYLRVAWFAIGGGSC